MQPRTDRPKCVRVDPHRPTRFTRSFTRSTRNTRITRNPLTKVRPFALTGSKVEKVAEKVSISLNRNCVAGDKSALAPGGVRIGTPAMTTRGMLEADFVKVAEFIDRIVKICVEIQEKEGKKLVDFEKGIDKHEGVAALRKEVEAVGMSLPFPGANMP